MTVAIKLNNSVSINEDDLLSWQSIVNIISETIDVPASFIVRTDPPYREIICSNSGNRYHAKNRGKDLLENHYCSKVVKTGNTVTIPDADNCYRCINNRDVESGMVSYMGYPLFWPDGEIFGTLSVMDVKKNNYDEKSRDLMNCCKKIIESQLNMYHQYSLIEYQRNELKSMLNNRLTNDEVLRICSYCKKIKDDRNTWKNLESFLTTKFNIIFSHCICTDCSKELFRT